MSDGISRRGLLGLLGGLFVGPTLVKAAKQLPPPEAPPLCQCEGGSPALPDPYRPPYGLACSRASVMLYTVCTVNYDHGTWRGGQ